MFNSKDKYLYVFFHMPKSAGSTMRFHIKKNIKMEERLLVSYKFLEVNPQRLPLKASFYKTAFKKHILKISRQRRRKIKIVYGHYVPYGIHEYFDKPVRYFTFLRNPTSRVKSLYKYIVYLYKKNLPEINRRENFPEALLINGKLPDFSTWLHKRYNPKKGFGIFSMVNTLKLFGYIKSGNNTSKTDLIKCLNKFYFIGTRSNYNEESLYIYSKLGFHKYFFDQNIMGNNIDINMTNDVLKNYLSEIDPNSLLLFDLAIKKGEKFRKENIDYYNAIKIKRLEKRLFLPITQTLFSPRNTVIRFYRNMKKGDTLFSDIRKT